MKKCPVYCIHIHPDLKIRTKCKRVVHYFFKFLKFGKKRKPLFDKKRVQETLAAFIFSVSDELSPAHLS